MSFPAQCSAASAKLVQLLMSRQVLVEAETQDGQHHSILLQNAETVRLVGPCSAQQSLKQNLQTASGGQPTAPDHESSSEAISVSELRSGQSVYLHLQGAARHTGISIQESIVEK